MREAVGTPDMDRGEKEHLFFFFFFPFDLYVLRNGGGNLGMPSGLLVQVRNEGRDRRAGQRARLHLGLCLLFLQDNVSILIYYITLISVDSVQLGHCFQEVLGK